MGWSASLAQEVAGRQHQEDSAGFAFDAEASRGYAVVADGLGGHARGEEASAAAVAAVAAVWERTQSAAAPIDRHLFVADAIALAHQRVLTLNLETGADAKTTICCACFAGNLVTIGNVGDSRAYLAHGRKLTRITRDHSVLEMLVAQGEISEAQMRGHPDGNRLTQVLGTTDAPRPYLQDIEAPPGTALLLCSDGLWQGLPPKRIFELMRAPGDGATALAAAAAAASGPDGDNVTALLLHQAGGTLRRVAGWLRGS